MGQDKGLMSFRGRPLVQYAIDAISPITSDVTIVTSNESYGQFGHKLIADLHPDMGPLNGVYSALKQTDKNHVFVIACDMPFVSSELVRCLIDEQNGAVTLPVFHGRWQPLVACYSKACLPVFEKLLLGNERKLQSAIASVDPYLVDIHDGLPFYHKHLFDNLNTPETFDEANDRAPST